MLKLLERNIATIDERLVLLAPPQAVVPSIFENVAIDCSRHRRLLRELQRLRGSIYLRDGAVDSKQLSPDGLHQTPEDDRSWHLVMFNRHRRISACAWYLQHDEAVQADDLRVRTCPLAGADGWRSGFRKAVELEIANARRSGLHLTEVGGWAVAKESRRTSEGLVLALAGFSLGRICGGTLGITTATVRHCSSTILRRLGGSPLEVDGTAVPAYYDPKYKCMMELLRFDSRRPNAKYVGLVERLREMLPHVPVIANRAAAVPQPLFAA
jgi:hypothetical protein